MEKRPILIDHKRRNSPAIHQLAEHVLDLLGAADAACSTETTGKSSSCTWACTRDGTLRTPAANPPGGAPSSPARSLPVERVA